MAYVKTNWQTGDVITAAKLNNMETGIYDATEAAADAFVADIDDPQDGDVIKYDSTEGKWVNGTGGGDSGTLLITINTQTMALNKTWTEIGTAMSQGKICVVLLSDGTSYGMMFVTVHDFVDDAYVVAAMSAVMGESSITVQTFKFVADSQDGYPVMSV